jgi:hypothetical protein
VLGAQRALQVKNRAREQLVARIAEAYAGAPVHLDDVPFEVVDENGVGCLVEGD